MIEAHRAQPLLDVLLMKDRERSNRDELYMGSNCNCHSQKPKTKSARSRKRRERECKPTHPQESTIYSFGAIFQASYCHIKRMMVNFTEIDAVSPCKIEKDTSNCRVIKDQKGALK